MRSEQCANCPHLRPSDEVCERKGVPISQIKGCSLSPSGKKFFRARHGKEAIRLRMSDKTKGEQG